MGLENTRPDFRPDDFNVNWPEGLDDCKYGDDHIRLIKLATYNFWQDYGDYKVNVESLFNGSKAKEAVQADNAAKLNNEDPSRFARVDGDYSSLRARATTKYDVGLSRVSNYYISDSATSNSTTNYASSRAVKKAYDKAASAESLAGRPTTAKGIGSTVFAVDHAGNSVKLAIGGTRAGSALQPAGLVEYGGQSSKRFLELGGRLAGTWRCLGASLSNRNSITNTPYRTITLWVRIS